MLMAVIAVLGVLFSIWALVGDVARVEIKSLARLHRLWLQVWTGLALAFVLLVPFVEAAIFHRAPPTEAGKALTLALESLLLAGITAASLWPLRSAVLPGGGPKWDLELVEAATGRIQELVRQGKASTAAAVVANIVEHSDRSNPEDGESDAYEELLDWCMRHNAFVEAIIIEQTETTARLLRAQGRLAQVHSDRLLSAAFASPPYLLCNEIARCRQPASDALGEVIPSDCIILQVLLEEPEVAQRISAWRPVVRSLLEEYRLRRDDPRYPDPDLSCPSPYMESNLVSLTSCGIHFLRLLSYAGIRAGLDSPMGVESYVDLGGSILRNMEARHGEMHEHGSSCYEFAFFEMIKTLSQLVRDSARLDRAVLDIDSVNRSGSDQHRTSMFYATVLGTFAARACRPTRMPKDMAGTTIYSMFDEMDELFEDDLEMQVETALTAFASEVRKRDRHFALRLIEEQASFREGSPEAVKVHQFLKAALVKR